MVEKIVQPYPEEVGLRKYCKAYKLSDMRRFQNWSMYASPQSQELPDDTICYLYDDFHVVQNPFQEGTTLIEQITPEWEAFCTQTLQFAIPEDLQYA